MVHLSAAADYEGRGNTVSAVQVLDLFRDLISDLFHHGIRELPDLLGGNLVLDHHYIRICNGLLRYRVYLYLLCSIEIAEELLDKGLCKLIPGMGYHPVGRDGAVLCNADIAGTGSHINECDIQHPVIFGDRKIYRRDRLEGQVRDGKSRPLDRGIKTINNIRRKEGDYYHLFYPLCLVPLKV